MPLAGRNARREGQPSDDPQARRPASDLTRSGRGARQGGGLSVVVCFTVCGQGLASVQRHLIDERPVPFPDRKTRPMRHTQLLTTACAAALLPLAVAAQDTPFVLDDIVVQGGLVPTPADRTGATVEVIDGTTVQSSGPTITSSLRRLPGVTVTENGGLGTSASVRIRGLGPAYVGVRIDGIEVGDPSGVQNSFDFGSLISGTIGSVTVLKGTQSAIYGSDAIAGVVDISSWRPSELGFSGEARIEGGTHNTYSGALSLGYLDDRTELAFTVARVETDGFSTRDTNNEDDGFEQTALNLYGAYQVTDSVRLGFSGFYTDGTVEIDDFLGDPPGEIDEERTGLRLFAEIETGSVSHEIGVSGFRNERFDEGGFTETFIGERAKVEYIGRADVGTDTTLAFGADWTKEQAELDADDYDAKSWAVFGEVLHSFTPDLDVQVTLRYDDFEDFGGELSGRAAMSWRAAPATIVRASVGTGYRAPSLYERFGPFGDDDLDAETSRSVDLGVERQFGDRGFVQATLFYTEIDDLIGFDFDTSTYQQIDGTTKTKGIELSGQYAVTDRVTVFGAYTYTDAETDGERLIRVPRHDLIVGADAQFTDALSGSIEIQHVADTLDGFGTPEALDDYTLLGLSLAYDVTEQAEVFVRVENALDEEYQTVLGFNTPGAAVYVGLRTTF